MSAARAPDATRALPELLGRARARLSGAQAAAAAARPDRCGAAPQGIPMQPEHVARFRAHVLEGRWGAALALLPQLAPDAQVELQVRTPGQVGLGPMANPVGLSAPTWEG